MSSTPRLTKVLIITGDPIGKKLAGPAIRAWNMALELSKENDVTLLSLSGFSDLEAPFKIVCVRPGENDAFSHFEKWADAIIFQGHAMLVFEALQRSTKIIVVDIYDPMHLEQLEQARELPRKQWDAQVADATEVLNDQLRRGDFFLCASERQRFFWLGQLAALGRVNTANYEHDPDLTGLISVAPFGLSRTEPLQTRAALKGVHPGISLDDKLLLWSGGLYNWFDPHTLIRAVAILAQKHPNVRLFFQGTKHPHPGVPEMEIVQSSRSLARELGVLDVNVFFNDSWVDFDDRQNYLLEADLGVSTHHSHVETMFSFRTRILDYLWANLPMVVTEGDHFGDLVCSENLGIAVTAGNVEELTSALEKSLFDVGFRAEVIANVSRVRRQYFWDIVLEPLVSFVRAHRYASDHSHIPVTGLRASELPQRTQTTSVIKLKIAAVRNTFREQGVSGVVNKTVDKFRRPRK